MPAVQTYGGTVRVIDGVVKAGCCCDPCCDDVGGPPTADFSYDQTDDSPCTLDLNDESTNGTCGTINQWRWYKNGVLISTAQNPTGITYTDGDIFSLEVETNTGCTDSVEMEVPCDGDCSCCPDFIPASVTVTLSGIVPTSPPEPNCPACNDINDSYVCTASGGAGATDCVFSYDELGFSSCGIFGTPLPVDLSINVDLCNGAPGVFVVTVVFNGATIAHSLQFRLTRPSPCRGTWDVPLFNATGVDPECDVSGATCTLTI